MIYFLSNKKILLPIVVVLIVIFLIFLPELIGLKNTNLQHSYEEYIKEQETLEKEEIEEISKEENQEQEEGEQAAVESTPATATSEKGIFGKSIPANHLKSKKNKRLLSNASRGVKRVKSKLPKEYVNSHAALKKFSALIYNIAKGKVKASPEELVSSLENMDIEVTTILLKEYIPRTVLLKWVEVNLSEFYLSDRATNLKRLAVSQFDPKFQIMDVSYKLKRGKYRLHRQNVDRIDVNFTLLGESIKSITLYKNGKVLRRVKAKKNLLSDTWYQATIKKIRSLSGVYSFLLQDVTGAKYIKHYHFNKELGGINITVDPDKTSKKRIYYKATLKRNFSDNANFLDKYYHYQPPITRQLIEGEYQSF